MSLKKVRKMLSEYQVRKTILDSLKEDIAGVIDQETVLYFEDRYNFSHESFRDFCKYLINIYDECYSKRPKSNSQVFGDYIYCFNYNKFDFIVRLLIGQGSAYQLINPKKTIMKVHKIKFDKNNKINLKLLTSPIKT